MQFWILCWRGWVPVVTLTKSCIGYVAGIVRSSGHCSEDYGVSRLRRVRCGGVEHSWNGQSDGTAGSNRSKPQAPGSTVCRTLLRNRPQFSYCVVAS
ncbi:hypothetical protein EDB87DRAFT_1645137 [Lactarius vividus]|nr:hypothetical protein EDB87DRAFT_1645137 [Lactarius vividus]